MSSFQGSLALPKTSIKRLAKPKTPSEETQQGMAKGEGGHVKFMSPNSCRRIFGRPSIRDKAVVIIEKVSRTTLL